MNDANSKTVRAAATAVRDPVLLAEQCGELRLERQLYVPRELAFLEGHYPGRPLVAGIVQLRWVMDAARALLGTLPSIVAFEGLRFRDVLRPEQELRMWLEISDARDLLRFQLDAAADIFATGRVRLGERPGL